MAGFDINAVVNKAAKEGPNMNEAKKGGGGYKPPAEGVARARFIGYIEGGEQEHNFQGAISFKPKVKLIFELSGPKWQPTKTEDGKLIPQRITVTETLSLSEKAHFYKIFRSMNYDGEATHIAQLLGQDFRITITHVKTKNGNIIALPKGRDGQYKIESPIYEDPESGEQKRVTADPQISETRVFLWDYPSKEMWDSLFIDGQYDEEKDDKGNVTRPAKSKNVLQEWIMGAKNWRDSEMYAILNDGGSLDTGDIESNDDDAPWEKDEESKGAADEDPLAGVS